jgi:hypothetical protein
MRIINIRISDQMLSDLNALTKRLNITRTEAILNAITLQNQLLSTPPKPQRTPPNVSRPAATLRVRR